MELYLTLNLYMIVLDLCWITNNCISFDNYRLRLLAISTLDELMITICSFLFLFVYLLEHLLFPREFLWSRFKWIWTNWNFIILFHLFVGEDVVFWMFPGLLFTFEVFESFVFIIFRSVWCCQSSVSLFNLLLSAFHSFQFA